MQMRTTFMALAATSLVGGVVLDESVVWLTKRWMPWTRTSLLLMVALVATVLAVFAGYRLSQMFRRRLFDIEEAAVLVAGGRLHHRVARFGERDEIDQVAAEFNRMGEQLEAQVGLLQRLAEENRSLAQEAERVATMEERQRLARDLHDSVSQELFALTMLSETAIRRLETGSPKLPDTLQQIADLANRAQREMRALLLHLRPVELEGRSFQEAAEGFLRAIAERHDLVCLFEFNVRNKFPELVEEQLFRILQEAVANVLKHANASEVRVRVVDPASAFELVVSDNGVGIAEDLPAMGDALGLRAMKERAARLGGRLEIWPRNPGTTVQVVIPVAEKGERRSDSSTHR